MKKYCPKNYNIPVAVENLIVGDLIRTNMITWGGHVLYCRVLKFTEYKAPIVKVTYGLHRRRKHTLGAWITYRLQYKSYYLFRAPRSERDELVLCLPLS